MISLDEAKKAWAYAPKGKYNARQRDDLSTATWRMVERPAKKWGNPDAPVASDPVLEGAKWKLTAVLNEKQNIVFEIEKL